MKLNLIERWVVNNPLRKVAQRLEVAWFKRHKRLPPNTRILEIGCGRGAGGALVAQAFRPAHLHLLDLDFTMVRLAQRPSGHAQSTIRHLWVADSVSLPFQPATFDAVFGFGFLHHVPRWPQALTEIFRVLKPRGIYYAEELFPALYQNAITRRLLVHPADDRFEQADFVRALRGMRMEILHAVALSKIGILCVAAKHPAG